MKAPILTLPLFPQLDRLLLEVLRSLAPADWHLPTISPRWTIKDIAAHLLDGNLRGLSMSRDGYFGETPGQIDSYQDLVAFLDRLNADWVQACRRLSPELLVSILDWSGRAYYEHLQRLDPEAPALFSVAWAGEEESANWFHIAREYTEKWHHQQQIRLAVGQEAALMSEELYRPFLETSLRALPHHYRTLDAPEATLLEVRVSGPGGGSWMLFRQEGSWQLQESKQESPNVVEIAGEVAWRLFTKGISREEARKGFRIQGETRLGEHLLGLVAVMG